MDVPKKWWWVVYIFVPIVCVLIGALVSPWLFSKQTLRATLTDLKVERGVSLEDYLARAEMSVEDYSTEELQEVGIVVNFIAEIEGFEGRECTLRWTVHSADTQSPVPGLWEENIVLIPEAQIDRASDYFWGPLPDEWIPFPSDEYRFFVRLELYDDQRVRLTYADTEEITRVLRHDTGGTGSDWKGAKHEDQEVKAFEDSH